jgi:signal transduction histidine kinase/ActR/RegA family two-component response regulator
MSGALLTTVIVVDAAASISGWTDVFALADLPGVVVADTDSALRRLDELLANGVEPDVVVLGAGVTAPIGAALRLHARAPQVQVVFVVDGAAAEALRREIALTPKLGSGWTIVPPLPEELVAAVRGASRATRRRRRLRIPGTRGRARRDPGFSVRQVDAERRRAELLALVAHELCDPLGPIDTALRLLEETEPASSEAAVARAVIARQHRRLGRVVTDLVDMSRIATDQLRIAAARVELVPVIGRAIDEVRPALARLGIALTTAFPAEPLWIDADAARIEQVMGQLLSNAMKYTDRGGRIWVTVAPVGARAGERRVVIAVRDTGIGIADEVRDHVFEMFVAAPELRDRSRAGLGIGLMLARHLVELHHGELAVNSAGPGKGSVFTIRLPVAEPPVSLSPVAAAAAARARALRILIVDDTADAADTLELVLRRDGHDVRAAYDGPGALLLAASFQPEVVLVDPRLAGMSGTEVASRLRAARVEPNPVVVALRGRDDVVTADGSAPVFDHRLVEPARVDDLRALLARVAPREA